MSQKKVSPRDRSFDEKKTWTTFPAKHGETDILHILAEPLLEPPFHPQVPRPRFVGQGHGHGDVACCGQTVETWSEIATAEVEWLLKSEKQGPKKRRFQIWKKKSGFRFDQFFGCVIFESRLDLSKESPTVSWEFVEEHCLDTPDRRKCWRQGNTQQNNPQGQWTFHWINVRITKQ